MWLMFFPALLCRWFIHEASKRNALGIERAWTPSFDMLGKNIRSVSLSDVSSTQTPRSTKHLRPEKGVWHTRDLTAAATHVILHRHS